jgi:hypothetical protein
MYIRNDKYPRGDQRTDCVSKPQIGILVVLLGCEEAGDVERSAVKKDQRTLRRWGRTRREAARQLDLKQYAETRRGSSGK